MQELNSERREHFRINDNILLDYLPLSDIDVEEIGQHIISFDDSNDQQRIKLNLVLSSFKNLIDQVDQSESLISNTVSTINTNLNILRHAIQHEHINFDNTKEVDANLSGGGIACLIAEKIPVDTAVEVKVQLKPSGVKLHAITRVISCREIMAAPQNTPFYLRLEFTHLHEGDRVLLVEHAESKRVDEILD